MSEAKVGKSAKGEEIPKPGSQGRAYLTNAKRPEGER